MILSIFGVHMANARSSYQNTYNSNYGAHAPADCSLCHPGGNTSRFTAAGNAFGSSHNYAAIAPAPHVTGFSIPSTSASLTVQITTFTATDNVYTPITGCMVTESATPPNYSAAGWSPTPPTSYIFATAGAKTLYAWALDFVNVVSPYMSASTTITLPSPPPVINSFTATPPSITSGQSSTLSWTLSGGAPTTLSIDNGVGGVPGLTSKVVTPSATTTYTLTASNSAGTVTQSVTVTVTPAITAPVINSFTAAPPSITSGQSSTLSWTLSGGAPTTLSIDNGVGGVPGLTSKVVTPSATTTYTLTASNSAGTVTQSVTLTVTPAVTAPVINSFTATPPSITSGQSSTLSWTLSGGAPTTLSIDNGVGGVLGLTSKVVTPSATTTYTLTASNSAGTVTQSVTLTVTPAVTAPVINSFTAAPPFNHLRSILNAVLDFVWRSADHLKH